MSEGTEPVLAGDWKDDDGIVLDSLLQENTDASTNAQAPADKSFTPVKPVPDVPTRITGTKTRVVAGAAPQQVLWHDPNRIHFGIRINSLGGASDVVRWSDDPGLMASGQMCPDIVTSQPLDVVQHTGRLYVYAPTADADVTVWAVTR